MKLKSLRNILFFFISIISLQCSNNGQLPHGDKGNGGISVPGDFEAVVVVDSIGPARHIAVNDNGDIYVKLSMSRTGAGGNIALRDSTNDGKADVVKRFGDYLEDGSMATAMKIHDGYLYFSTDRVLYRNKLTAGKLIPDSHTEVVLTDDHKHGSHWHITKPVSFDNRGKMYVPFGVPSNACQDLSNSPAGFPGLPGLDPCPELEDHGGIWMFDAGRTGLTQKDGRKFCTGIRSVVAMDWNSADSNLYVVMHGRDDLHLLWPGKFSAWESAVLPSEEFLKINQGDDFGWPYCYYDQLQHKKVLSPEYGGDGKITGRCNACQNPVMGFPGHWAPNDLLFYQGDQFPARYKNGAFIAFHGSTNRAPYPQAGYFVCFVPFKNGQPTGEWEVFADGFAGKDTIISVSDAVYRPMGLAVGPDGSLYIIDSNKGKIWRILYRGNKNNFGAAQLEQMDKRKLLSNIRTPDEVKDKLDNGSAKTGRQVYNTYCRTCHQGNGKGDGIRFPPLDSSEWVNGDKAKLMSIVLNGLSGTINVKGRSYYGAMPGHAFLTDSDIALVLTYVRQGFGNKASSIDSLEVKKLRHTLKNKN